MGRSAPYWGIINCTACCHAAAPTMQSKGRVAGPQLLPQTLLISAPSLLGVSRRPAGLPALQAFVEQRGGQGVVHYGCARPADAAAAGCPERRCRRPHPGRAAACGAAGAELFRAARQPVGRIGGWQQAGGRAPPGGPDPEELFGCQGGRPQGQCPPCLVLGWSMAALRARSRRGVQPAGSAAPPPPPAPAIRPLPRRPAPCCRLSWCSSGWRWMRASRSRSSTTCWPRSARRWGQAGACSRCTCWRSTAHNRCRRLAPRLHAWLALRPCHCSCCAASQPTQRQRLAPGMPRHAAS